MVPWAPTNPYPIQHLDRFSRFSTVHARVQHTDRQIYHATTATIGCILRFTQRCGVKTMLHKPVSGAGNQRWSTGSCDMGLTTTTTTTTTSWNTEVLPVVIGKLKSKATSGLYHHWNWLLRTDCRNFRHDIGFIHWHLLLLLTFCNCNRKTIITANKYPPKTRNK